MAELTGDSVLLLRVTPGRVEEAIRELKRNPSVREAEPVLGPYDIAVTGAFRDSASLRRFAEEVESKEYCEGCVAYPSYEHWSRERVEEKPARAWTLIRTRDAARAVRELQKVPGVQRILSTVGEFNVVANIAVDEPHEIQSTVLRDIQKISGVRRTETLANLRESER